MYIRAPALDHRCRSETHHRPKVADRPVGEGSAQAGAAEALRFAVVAASLRTLRKTWRSATMLHCNWDNSYSNMLDDDSFRFFYDDVRGLFGGVREIEISDVFVRYDKMFL